MNYNLMNVESFIKKFQTSVPTQENLKSFREQISDLLKVDNKETEEHQKNALSSFLEKSFGYQCNTKERIDLAIYEYGQARVIFECKRLNNTSEFVRDENNLDSKAFYESILYYLCEFLTHKNNNLTFIILTNTRDFYLIDAKEYFDLLKNKAIKKAFENCEKKQGNDTSTGKFYEEIKEILQDLDHTITYTHFTLTFDLNESELSHIYQVLSPKVLLKAVSYIDANILNRGFYNELLYILGLDEIVEGSKVLIQPSSTSNTLLYSICQAFKLDRVKDFESIFSLITTWNNRILFLRLLESMLLSFKHINTPFLHIECIMDFPTLNTLFFEVLAKKEKERSNIPDFLKSIPYLNSSLFDRNALELNGKEIKLLDSNDLELYPHSILHKDEAFKDYKDQKSLPLLEYLFAFLRAYDFTTIPSDIKDNIKINQNKLINSAVLGLVFEKLNGYKEGSFYTPSFITNYMCKQSLEKVVIDKFNQAKSWDCQDLESLKRQIDKLTDSKDGYKQANDIFNSIRVCDPSVGSGHFLVSVLNQLIALKYNLQILCDEDHQRLKDIKLELQNDEIVIRDSANQIFQYSLPAHENIESHKLQKALFQAKRKLIESCLFGVDINPNSCEITKLRLWIELLKFSYYKDIDNKHLETLPNIDINIKCGNSLVSRFDIKDSLKHIPNIRHQIDIYKKLVNDYKNADRSILSKSKGDIEDQIERIKETFKLTLKDPKTKDQLQKAIDNHIILYGNYLLDDESLLDGLQQNIFGTPNLSEEEKEKALDSYGHIQALRKKLDLALKGETYKDSFEWRFEFPEVLSEEGDFLGFDLIIGNPPYMQVSKGLYSKSLYPYSEGKDKGKQNLYKVFIELGFNLGHQNSVISLITQSSIMCDLSAQFTRELLLTQTQMRYFVEFKHNEKIFTNVSQGVCILEFAKAKPNPNHSFKIAINNSESRMDEIDFESITQDEILDFFPLYEIPLIKKGEMPIVAKVKKDKLLLKEMIESSLQGNINTIHLKRIQSETETGLFLMKGENIHRYYFDRNFMYCVKSEETLKICERNSKCHIIALQGIHTATSKNRIHCALLESKNTNVFVFLHSTKMLFLSNVKEAKYLVGLLNSKLLNWLFRLTSTNNNINLYELESLPIPKPDSKNKKLTDKVISLVDEILESKKQDLSYDTSVLESKIDSLVYELYGLSEEEIGIIEGELN